MPGSGPIHGRVLGRGSIAAPYAAPIAALLAAPIAALVVADRCWAQGDTVAIQGVTGETSRVPQPTLIAEGTFFVRAPGRLVAAPSGERVFVFRPVEGRPTPPPMVLVPCANVYRMEQLSAGRAADADFVITGEVFVYEGRNFLLPTVLPSRAESSESSGEPGAEATPLPPEQPTGDAAQDADVQSLIRALEEERSQARALSRERVGGTGPEAESARAAHAEGTLLVRRRGRLTRTGSGQWVFALDNMPGQSQADPPMLIAPCLNLERMRSWAQAAGDGTTFVVSGRMLAYRDQNILVPTMFLVEPPNDFTRR